MTPQVTARLLRARERRGFLITSRNKPATHESLPAFRWELKRIEGIKWIKSPPGQSAPESEMKGTLGKHLQHAWIHLERYLYGHRFNAESLEHEICHEQRHPDSKRSSNGCAVGAECAIAAE